MATDYAHNPNQLFSLGFEEDHIIDGRACQNVALRSMDLLLASRSAMLLFEGMHMGLLKTFHLEDGRGMFLFTTQLEKKKQSNFSKDNMLINVKVSTL